MAFASVNRNPGPRDLRVFGWLLLAFFGIAGALARWRFGAPGVGVAIWAGGLGLVLAYLFLPGIRRRVYIGWSLATFPIGWAVSHLLLAVVFYAVITPVGAIMRVARIDPLSRRFDRRASSYWEEYNPGRDRSRYFRQY